MNKGFIYCDACYGLVNELNECLCVLSSNNPLCLCCNHFSVRNEVDLCGWCVDCPTNHCDIPEKFLVTRPLEN